MDEDTRKEQIVNKIKKLLARTTSNFTAEAENAILKAQDLIARYNIDMMEIPNSPQQEITTESIRKSYIPLWHGSLALIIAPNFRCTGFWQHNNHEDKTERSLNFIGLKDDARAARDVFIYAVALINYNIRRIKKRYPRVTKPYINTYIDGFISGLDEKFASQVQQNNYGLILIKPDAVLEMEKELNLEPGPKLHLKYSDNDNAYNNGYSDGYNFSYKKLITN